MKQYLIKESINESTNELFGEVRSLLMSGKKTALFKAIRLLSDPDELDSEYVMETIIPYMRDYASKNQLVSIGALQACYNLYGYSEYSEPSSMSDIECKLTVAVGGVIETTNSGKTLAVSVAYDGDGAAYKQLANRFILPSEVEEIAFKNDVSLIGFLDVCTALGAIKNTEKLAIRYKSPLDNYSSGYAEIARKLPNFKSIDILFSVASWLDSVDFAMFVRTLMSKTPKMTLTALLDQRTARATIADALRSERLIDTRSGNDPVQISGTDRTLIITTQRT